MNKEYSSDNSDTISKIKDSSKLKISPFDDRNETVRAPIKFCEFIAKHPRKALAISSSFYFLAIVVSLVLFFVGFDLFPTRFSGIKMEVRTKSYVQRNKAFLSRKTAPGYLPRVEYGQQERAIPSSFFEVIFQTTNKSNILTKPHLLAISKIQESIMKSEGFNDFCVRAAGGTDCRLPNSMVTMFDKDDPAFNNIPMMINTLYQDHKAVTWIQQILGNDSIINSSYVFSTLTRLQFVLGGPLNNSKGKEDDEARMTKFLQNSVMGLLKDFASKPPPGLRIYFFGKAFLDTEIERFTFIDMILIAGSFSFILILLCVHTKSVFLGLSGMASIVGSFVLANLVYRLLLGFIYFGVCHVLSIFVILGIGADDIFVFVDTWKQSGVGSKYQFPSLAHRLSHVYRQAAIATALTSLTTIIAFLASAVSPILAISSFGVFSALLVLLTYVSVITFFPTALIFCHSIIKWEWSRCLRLIRKARRENYDAKEISQKQKQKQLFINSHLPTVLQSSTDVHRPTLIANGHTTDWRNGIEEQTHPFVNGYANGYSGVNIPRVSALPDLLNVKTALPADAGHFYSGDREVDRDSSNPASCGFPELKENNGKSFSLCVRFFRGPLFHILTHRIFKWIILSAFVGLVGTASYFTAQLVPEDRQVKLLSANTDIMKANHYRIHGFMADPPDASFEVKLIWGLKPQDLSGCRFRQDDDCPGELRLDPTFDMNNAEAQLAIRDLCLKLRNPTKKMVEDLRLRLNPVTKRPLMKCFILDLERYVKRFFISLPLNASNVRPFMERRPHLYDFSKLGPNFNRYFEVMLTHWLTDGYMMQVRDPMIQYDDFLGEANHSQAQPVDTYMVKSHWGASLVYMIISIETTMNFHVLGYPEGFKVGAAWDKFLTEQMKRMPNTTNKAFPEARKWRGLAISEALAKNAWQGVVIGISTSLFILTLTTMNVVVALIATLTIGLVTNCVIASIVLANWKLGPLESINMCLVVGLAVDYVVHLAEAYNRSLHSDRVNRVRDALEQVGVSVLSGAMTSLGASVFMMFANILFFVQFGIFMFITIGLSFIFAVGFFCTFMGIFGPEGTVGCLKQCGRRILGREDVYPIADVPLNVVSNGMTTG